MKEFNLIKEQELIKDLLNAQNNTLISLKNCITLITDELEQKKKDTHKVLE